MEPINMASAGTRVEIADNYFITLPPEPYLILVVGAKFGTPAYDFDHPTVIAKADNLFEFKHYRKNGGKRWTSKPGRNFAFAINKLNITLVPTQGYSYVPVKIGEETIRLNVSGGTFPKNGWTDSVRQGAHTNITSKRKLLEVIAHAAMLPQEAKLHGVQFEFNEMTKGVAEMWQADVVQRLTTLNVDDEIMLEDGWTINQSSGPFTITNKRPRAQSVIIGTPEQRRAKVTYRMIDWLDAAKRKGIFIPIPHISAKLLKTAPEEVIA